MSFLLIPFSFSGANMRHNDMTSGMPAMVSVAGMSFTAELALRNLGAPSLKVDAFSLTYFSLDRDGFSPRRPANGVLSGKPVSPALMDIRRGHGEAALILKISADQHDDYSAFCELLRSNKQRVIDQLDANLNFAGGAMFIGLEGEFGNRPLNVSLFENWADALRNMMRAYPTKGLLIQDMADLLSSHARAHSLSTLDAMMDLLHQNSIQRSDSKHQQPSRQSLDKAAAGSETSDPLPAADDFEDLDSLFDCFDQDVEQFDLDDIAGADADIIQPYLGVLLPTTIGYHEICLPQNGKHYVEPVLGLVRARVLPSLMRDLTENRQHWSSHFYSWEHDPQHRLYRTINYFKHFTEGLSMSAKKNTSTPGSIGVINPAEPIAPVFSYARSVTPSRALLYAASDIHGGNAEPLRVQTEGRLTKKNFDITQQVAKAQKDPSAAVKNGKFSDALKPSPQNIDTVYLPEDKPFLKAEFTVKYLCNFKKPHACSINEINVLMREFVGLFLKGPGIRILAERYAQSLCVGLFMFRNNDEAFEKRIAIKVIGDASGQEFVFTPGYNAYRLDQLDAQQQQRAAALTDLLEQALSGKRPLLGLNVQAIYNMGAGMPAYPSQEMDTSERKEGDVSRIYYRVAANGVNDQAALHDAKIGNALRTIDTWHGSELFDAVPVEPLGVVGTHMVSLRLEQKRDFYSLLKLNLASWTQAMRDGTPLTSIPDHEDLLYVISVLIRGGAFV